MISLVINSKCNQKCEYCFAYNTLHDNNTFMSLETCEEILDFQAKAKYFVLKGCVGIIGGEPTIHPQFDKILELFKEHSNKYNTHTMLFTNGTRLHEYDLDFSISGLINVNSPDITGINNYNNTCKSIEKYSDKGFNIGVNIYPGIKDYSFIIDIAKKYNIRVIRCAVACPDGLYMHMQDKRDDYFKSCIDNYLKFCNDIIKNDLVIHMDCCKIPLCYFTEEQKYIVNKACGGYHGDINICTPHIDVHSDLTATHCFIRPETISIKDFANPDSLSAYITTRWLNKMYANMQYGRCETCNTYKQGFCQGGCLRFAKGDI